MKSGKRTNRRNKRSGKKSSVSMKKSGKRSSVSMKKRNGKRKRKDIKQNITSVTKTEMMIKAEVCTSAFLPFYEIFIGRRVIGVELVIQDRKSTRLNSSHVKISYAAFCLK